MNTDKAFIQFAGLTAGRASSFFDFYAHDFELQTATAGSDLQSTNLLAYSTKLGTSGFSATLSLEDPLYRRNTIYSQEFASPAQGLSAVAPLRVLVTTSPLGIPTFQTVDVSQRSRMPDFVGVLRYDAAWGSAQLSAAVKELNTGNFIAGSTVCWRSYAWLRSSCRRVDGAPLFGIRLGGSGWREGQPALHRPG